MDGVTLGGIVFNRGSACRACCGIELLSHKICFPTYGEYGFYSLLARLTKTRGSYVSVDLVFA